MRKLFLLPIILFLFVSVAEAQKKGNKEVQIWPYNKVYMGRNYVAQFLYGINNTSTVGIGVSYHDNPFQNIYNTNWSYYNRYRAFNFTQRFGVDAEYRRYFKLGGSCVRPFTYYNLSVVRMGIRRNNTYLYGYDTLSNGQQIPLYTNSTTDYPNPFWTINQTIGVGLRCELQKRVFLTGRVGFANASLLGINNLGSTYNIWYEFSGTFSIGAAIILN